MPVWHNKLDLNAWRGKTDAADDLKSPCCCSATNDTCCALLEVTKHCNLHCKYCFAEGGDFCGEDPDFETIRTAISNIAKQGGFPLLQLSGGEPTLRDDLPEIVAFAKQIGIPTVQVNTNGIRLASDLGYLRSLKEAGLDIVFLQFDGTDDRIYQTLRGKALFEIKKKAIGNCGKVRLGVTLVPTIVRGVNDTHIGLIVDFAHTLSPVVRGVHFQPVSYFGRYEAPCSDRYTLDELIFDLCNQAGFKEDNFLPSCCDHPMCGFHGGFLVQRDGTLLPLMSRERIRLQEISPKENREYVANHWSAPKVKCGCCQPTEDSLEAFLDRAKEYSFTISAMAFQDSYSLDRDRLRHCSLHVYKEGALRSFCEAYLTAEPGGMCSLNPCCPEEVAAYITGGRVLDIGCGDGRMVSYLRSHGIDAYGVDMSPEMVKRAGENCCCAEVKLGRAECLPYSDESFDCILMQCSFSLCEAEKTISEINRILKHGGQVIITDVYSSKEEMSFPKSNQVSNLYYKTTIEKYFSDFELLDFVDKTKELVDMFARMLWDEDVSHCISEEELPVLKSSKPGYGIWVWKKF